MTIKILYLPSVVARLICCVMKTWFALVAVILVTLAQAAAAVSAEYEAASAARVADFVTSVCKILAEMRIRSDQA